MSVKNSFICVVMIFLGFVLGLGININTLVAKADNNQPSEVRVLHRSGVKGNYEIISFEGKRYIINYEGGVLSIN
jgi:hypothetical protein